MMRTGVNRDRRVQRHLTAPLRAAATRISASIIAASFVLGACSPLSSLTALCRSTDHFISYAGDDRVRIEPGAESYAALISPHITLAINKVEAAHHAPFDSQPTIYLCATSESFHRLTGQRAPAIVTRRLYLSPELFREHRSLDRYLAHELSHLHLVQRLGLVGSARLPGWFKEGLAELASDGATGASVPVSDAWKAINEGHRFVPDEGRNVVSSFLFPRYGSYWHMENSMFYRQSFLFVEFMQASRVGAFRRFLVDVENGRDFKKALHDAYPGGISTLWNSFLETGKAMTV